MKIQCYISLGCGSEQPLRENMKKALAMEGLDSEVAFQRIRDEEAHALGLRGSPCVLINGQDIEPTEIAGFS